MKRRDECCVSRQIGVLIYILQGTNNSPHCSHRTERKKWIVDLEKLHTFMALLHITDKIKRLIQKIGAEIKVMNNVVFPLNDFVCLFVFGV